MIANIVATITLSAILLVCVYVGGVLTLMAAVTAQKEIPWAVILGSLVGTIATSRLLYEIWV